MTTTTRLLRKGHVGRRTAVVRLLVKTGVARWVLVGAPVLLARGLLTVPNKSGLARLYLTHKANRGGGVASVVALTLSAAAVGAGAGYLAKSLRSG